MSLATDQRFELLKSAPLNSWIALSADKSRIVAYGKNLTEVIEQSEAAGEVDPVMLKTPHAWAPRYL